MKVNSFSTSNFADAVKNSVYQLDSILPDNVRYDRGVKRFRYVDNGRFVSRADTLSLQRRYLIDLDTQLINLASDMLRGKIGAYTDAANIVKQIHLNQAALARGGVDRLTQKDLGQIGSTLKKQYYQGKDPQTGKRFGLKHLLEEVKEGKVSEAMLRQRLHLYAESGKVSYFRAESNRYIEDGYKEKKRNLGIAEHCQPCLGYAARGWVPINDDLPLPTQRCDCINNCKCSMQYR